MPKVKIISLRDFVYMKIKQKASALVEIEVLSAKKNKYFVLTSWYRANLQ